MRRIYVSDQYLEEIELHFSKKHFPEVFQAFAGTMFEALHHYLIDEWKDETFLDAYQLAQTSLVKQVDVILEEYEPSIPCFQLSNTEQLDLAIDAFIDLGGICAQFQKDVAQLLSEHFPKKYPMFFYDITSQLQPLQQEIEEFKTEIELLKEKLEKKEEHLEHYRLTTQELKVEKKLLIDQQVETQHNLKKETEHYQRLKKSHDTLEHTIKISNEKIEEEQTKREKIQTDYIEFQKKARNTIRFLQSNQTETTTEAKHIGSQQLIEQVNELRKQNTALHQQNEAIRRASITDAKRMSSYSQTIRDLNEQQKKLLTEIEVLKNQLQSKNEAISQLVQKTTNMSPQKSSGASERKEDDTKKLRELLKNYRNENAELKRKLKGDS